VKGRIRYIFVLAWCCLLSTTIQAQHSKKVRALQKEKTELQKTLDKSQKELKKTKKQVQSGQRDLNFIGKKLENRVKKIRTMETDIDCLDSQIVVMKSDIRKVSRELDKEKAKLKNAIRYAASYRQRTSALLFVFSARTLTQMTRRARYAKEYVNFEHNLGKKVRKKHNQLLDSQNKLLTSKSHMNNLLQETISERKALSEQQLSTKKKVDGLKKKETGLAAQVKNQQKQLNALDRKIDDLIAQEIERAKVKQEKKVEQPNKQKQQGTQSDSPKNQESDNATKEEATPRSGSWLTAEDRQLSGSFAQNKGRLPVPITGRYMLGHHFGRYNVPGLKNVQLDSKGTDYVGQAGARARSVFGGQVTAVFQFGGTKNVLVRHGSYISVYCNLSSVIVTKGQHVNAKDLLGTVAQNSEGEYVLHFQLRKETSKLNPESWIAR